MDITILTFSCNTKTFTKRNVWLYQPLFTDRTKQVTNFFWPSACIPTYLWIFLINIKAKNIYIMEKLDCIIVIVIREKAFINSTINICIIKVLKQNLFSNVCLCHVDDCVRCICLFRFVPLFCCALNNGVS